MYPRNSHNDLDLSNDGSIDFNSSHGSFRYDGMLIRLTLFTNLNFYFFIFYSV